MDFRVLGPLEVHHEGERLPLGGPRQRLVLALLLAHANEVVSTDRLLEDVWRGEPAEGAKRTLQSYVSHLRRAIEGARPETLLRKDPGYVITVEPELIDAHRFSALTTQARAVIDADPAAATRMLWEALELWQGAPYADLGGEPALRPEITRLDELRLTAIEYRIDAELALGYDSGLVGELETLVQEYPLRERFGGQLMLALYRSGRQSEALRAYERTRRTLVEELGIDPSPELKELERQILMQDASLNVTPSGPVSVLEPTETAAATGRSIRGYELREQIGAGRFGEVHVAYQHSIGREVAVKVIRPRFADDPAFVRAFDAEAQLVARLEHPHIVPLYDFWREPRGAFIVMRLFRGGSAASVTSAWTWDALFRMVEQVGGGLDAAHRQGVVHGDVKGSNILFDEDRNAYLSDFGVARDLAADAATGTDRDAVMSADVAGLARVVLSILDSMEGASPALRELAEATAAGESMSALEFVASFGEAAGRAKPTPAGDADLPNPYLGLRPFAEGDAGVFFGRERLTADLVDFLSQRGPTGRFLAVVGPSGSGKSSAVNAGLIPALRRGAVPGSNRWFIVSMYPGQYPFDALAAALRRISAGEHASVDLTVLSAAAAAILRDDSAELLLVVDQFEELFTLVEDEATRSAFLHMLAETVADERNRVRVVITLRADFYDRPLQYAGFGELVRSQMVTVMPLSAAEMLRAISEPARTIGVGLEPGLAERIAGDVAGQPGMLPLVQYAMTEAFERRDGHLIPAAAYDASGGVSAALATRAEQVFESLSAAAQAAARQIFLRLVTVEEGAEDSRRRVRRGELDSIFGFHKATQDVLEAFGRYRLLSFDRDPRTRAATVEVAHEALLREWSRLRQWIEDHRDDVRSHRRLTAACREWVEADRSDDYLLSGGALDRLAVWAEDSEIALTAAERTFLQASVGAREEAEEIERARVAAQLRLERRSKRRTWGLVAVLATAIVTAVTLTVFAVAQRREADRQRELALVEATPRARELAAAALDRLTIDPQLAALLSLEAATVTADISGEVLPEVRDAMHWTLQASQVPYPADGGPVLVRPGPDGPQGLYDVPLSWVAEALTLAADGRVFGNSECLTYFQTASCSLSDTTVLMTAVVEPNGDTADPNQPLAGTTAVLRDPFWGEPKVSGFAAALGEFQESTGIEIEYETGLFTGNSPPQFLPDLVVASDPGRIVSAGTDTVIDIGMYLDRGALGDRYGDYLLSLVTIGESGEWPATSGSTLGLWSQLSIKNLVFYRADVFSAAGYDVPQTWGELLAVTERLAADGQGPWCMGEFLGHWTGAPGTDWVESLVLANSGAAIYDQWIRNDIPFDHPDIVSAGEEFAKIALGEGLVETGEGGVLLIDFEEVHRLFASDPPGCAMYMGPAPPPDLEFGIGYDMFPLPPISEERSPYILGGGEMIMAMRDRPEIRELMRFLASSDYPGLWSSLPHLDNDPPTAADPLQQHARELIRSGLQQNRFRFDGSDLMPGAIGTAGPGSMRELHPGYIFELGTPGSFLAGIAEIHAGELGGVEAIFSLIEADWQAYEAWSKGQAGSEG
ncbi:MAG: extracellular solute-binding protein [Acidimicrobiia bacterium]|nr:extracellular solute-binding protein [Acidimicrobiia bacterium]